MLFFSSVLYSQAPNRPLRQTWGLDIVTGVPISFCDPERISVDIATGRFYVCGKNHTWITPSTTGAVTSVFGRTGVVVAAINDYNFNQLAGTALDSQLTSSYSGVGACGAGTFVSTLTRNMAPTCTTPTAGVTSFNTRTGAVVPASSDYNFNQLAGNIAVSQMNSGISASSSTYWRGDATWAAITAGLSSWSGDGSLYTNAASTGAVTATLGNQAVNSIFAGPADAGQTHSIIQSAFANCTSCTSRTTAYTSNNTAGNLLIALEFLPGGGGGAVTPTSTAGDTWTQAATSIYFALYYSCAAVGGANSVTYTQTSSVNMSLKIFEMAGNTASCFDQARGQNTICASGTCTATTSGSVAQANEFVFAIFQDLSTYAGIPSTETLWRNDGGTGGNGNTHNANLSVAVYKNASSGLSGAQTLTVNYTGSVGNNYSIIACFKTNGTVSTKPTFRTMVLTDLPGGITGTGDFAMSLSPTITTPRIAQINDVNGLPYIKSIATASAVDWLDITNGATATPGVVTLSGNGSDASVQVKLQSKGASGSVAFQTGTNSTIGVRFLNSSGTILGGFDTTNSRLSIGSASAAGATLDVGTRFFVDGAAGNITKANNVTAAYSLPVAASCGTTTTCAKTSQVTPKMAWGTIALVAGVATITSLPTFTSTASFVCNFTRTVTTAMGVTYPSTTSVTFTSLVLTDTDTISYSCVGN